MKTGKDLLIDFAVYYKSEKIFGIYSDDEIYDNYFKSINPQNEPDGHRRLEDNKDEEENCNLCLGKVSCRYAVLNEKCRHFVGF